MPTLQANIELGEAEAKEIQAAADWSKETLQQYLDSCLREGIAESLATMATISASEREYPGLPMGLGDKIDDDNPF